MTDLANAVSKVLTIVRDGHQARHLPELFAHIRRRVSVTAIVPPGIKLEHDGLVARCIAGIPDAASLVVIDDRIVWKGTGLFNGGLARRLKAPRAATLLQHALARTTGVASPSSTTTAIQTRETYPTCGALLVATRSC
ncbi:MAG TPA: hypothetical protein VEP50_09765 [bacterium]|nr:hypothetical protein [bacterium]